MKKEEIKEVLGMADVIIGNFSHLVGKVLTILEASIPDSQQQKSMKYLVQQEIYDCRNLILDGLKLDVPKTESMDPETNIE